MHRSEAVERAWAGMWALVGFAVCTFVARYEPSLLEEGLLLHVAERLVGGEHLYRDVASFTGPVPFEFLAALFRVFGSEIAVARAAVAVLCGLATASVFDLARRAGVGAWAHGAAASVAFAPILLFPLLAIYFHTTIAYYLTWIAAFAAVRGVRSGRWALAAGVLIATVVLCKQTVGVVLATVLVIAVPLCADRGQRLRRGLSVAAGGLAAALVTLAIYAARGELGVLVDSLVVLPLSFDATFSSPYMNLWPLGHFAREIHPNKYLYLPSLWSYTQGPEVSVPTALVFLTQVLFALPAVALVATAVKGISRPLPPAVWVHAGVAAALASNLFPRADWGHLVFAVPAALAQIQMLAPRPRRLPGRLAPLLVVAALAGGGAAAAKLVDDTAGPATFGPRVPQRPVNAQLRSPEPARVIKFLREHVEPGEKIFVARSEPLIYFATGTTNPTPYSGVIPGFRKEQEQAIIRGLEDVRFVVMSDIDQPLYTYYRDELPAVQKYLERYFEVRNLGPETSWITLLERVPDRGQTIFDFVDATPRARWIRDAKGEVKPAGPLPKLATRFNRRPLVMRLGAGGGGDDFDVNLPENAWFESGVGIRKLGGASDRFLHAPDSALRVSVFRHGQGQAFDPIYVLSGEHHGLRWYPMEIDLSELGPGPAMIRLELISREPIPRARYAFWGSPRIVVREPSP